MKTLAMIPDITGDPDQNDRLALLMSALGHPARIAILHRLGCCDACCCKDVVQHLDLAQSTVSQHLKILVQAGLVTYEPARQKSRYVLNRTALEALSG
jgi:DNA-binding transcriptional ArsR family regulator